MCDYLCYRNRFVAVDLASREMTQGEDVDADNQEYEFGKAAYRWHSWDSPVGLAVGLVGLALSLTLVLSSVGLILWLLHQAKLIG